MKGSDNELNIRFVKNINPVNKKIDYRNRIKTSNLLIKRKVKKNKEDLSKNSISLDNSGVSVITCTHMYRYMDNIINNFLRQRYPKKELILILNNNSLNLEEWKKKIRKYSNIKIFKIDESITVGSCMNFAVKQSKYYYVANFDHDDYYGPEYLNDFIKIVNKIDAGLFGKRTQYVYFEKTKKLTLRHPNKENKYVNFIDGPTVFFKKSIFEKVKYIDSDAADLQFSYDCTKHGIKIYSINKENFCYIRRASLDLHTWKVEDDSFPFLYYKTICITDDFRKHVNKK